MTLVETCASDKRFAKSYYVERDGKPSDWHQFIKDALLKFGQDQLTE